MEQYKNKLKQTQKFLTLAAVVLMIFSIVALASQAGLLSLAPIDGDSHWQSMWRGIVCGAGCALSVLLLAWIIRISKALRSDKELKKLYVEAHDERQTQIYISARATSMQIFLIGGLVAGIVAGYFSATVSITILACVVIHSLLGGACKLYYSKKF